MKNKAMRGTGDPNRPRPPDDPEQSKRFEDAARELGADESGAVFKRLLDEVVPTRELEQKSKKGPS